ncbi:hypothetical protein G7Z17_g10563 [Cylindrodendrum hubeiense]|uniref:GPI anchored serine-threonine rich protein n=1 Tax=Cylindrodendrum hubeiense TaxID=595255 RepID=A0A9P5LB38_9HYPO|nr:hypothetical protein G7Z17_g10563 [Cylindrodendrum hubeiense]
MNKFILLALSATGALAAANSPFLAAREIYQVPCSETGQKECGNGCIDSSWTCCPSGAGGCPSDATCYLGTNGEYGCCPEGTTCGGEGGASTDASTNTVTIPGEGETSTLVTEATSTGGYEQPPVETPSSVAVETPSSEAVDSYTQVETLQTETQTYVQPVTTPAGVLPTYGSNGTQPAATTPPAVTGTDVPSVATAFGVSMVGGLVACAAAALLI